MGEEGYFFVRDSQNQRDTLVVCKRALLSWVGLNLVAIHSLSPYPKIMSIGKRCPACHRNTGLDLPCQQRSQCFRHVSVCAEKQPVSHMRSNKLPFPSHGLRSTFLCAAKECPWRRSLLIMCLNSHNNAWEGSVSSAVICSPTCMQSIWVGYELLAQGT